MNGNNALYDICVGNLLKLQHCNKSNLILKWPVL